MVFRLILSLSSRMVWPRPEVDIGGREVIQALVVAPVVVVLDEGAELGFEVTGQIIVLEQDPVLEGLVPALDLALGLGMVSVPTTFQLPTKSV